MLGPERIYGEGGIYHVLTWGFVIGALLPLPVYLYTLRYPRSWLRHVYVPVILAGALNWAPYVRLGFSQCDFNQQTNLRRIWHISGLHWYPGTSSITISNVNIQPGGTRSVAYHYLYAIPTDVTSTHSF